MSVLCDVMDVCMCAYRSAGSGLVYYSCRGRAAACAGAAVLAAG